MKKFLLAFLALTTFTTAFTQKKDTTVTKQIVPVTPGTSKKDWSKVDLTHRANDHFMMQLGYANWSGTPDTLSVVGFSRSFNFYFMYDFPFKSDPRLSVGAGIGFGNANVFFSGQPAPVNILPQQNASGGTHFKKYKLVSTYLQIPVELRFAMDPENTNKSWKFAVGVKVGPLLNAYAKGKDVENSSNQLQDGSVYKVGNRSDFNPFDLVGTARISKGFIGVYAQYQVTSLIKGAYGPIVYPFEFGICLSGL